MEKPLSEMTTEELWKLFPVILREHNPCYPEWYEGERENILKTLSENVVRISHIGSSAVARLTSKPTVDILLEMGETSDIAQVTEDLQAGGWTLMSRQERPVMKLALNKGYMPQGFAEKVFHLHVRFFGDWDELYFRDYLIAHPEAAAEYGKLKRRLQRQYPHNRDAYTEGKTEFVLKVSRLAKEAFPGRYRPGSGSRMTALGGERVRR